MNIITYSKAFSKRLSFLKTCAQQASLWQNELNEVVQSLSNESDDIQVTLNDLHRAQRLERVFVSGQENNQEFFDDFQNTEHTLWKDFVGNPASDDLQKQLADKLYKAEPNSNSIIMIYAFQQYIRVIPFFIQRCMTDNNQFDITFVDYNFNNLLQNYCSNDMVIKLGTYVTQEKMNTTHHVLFHSNFDTDGTIKADKTKEDLFKEASKPYTNKKRTGEIQWVLTRVPSPNDEKTDGIPYKEYTQLFFEMCDQPWDHIDKAQRALIAELDATKEIRFTNNDGTDISMNVDGFTFANSLIWRNVPGSEAFSSPRIDSAEGIIIAKGKYDPKDGVKKIIENITMEFKNGKLIHGVSETNNEQFQKLLNEEEGNRFIGELGIGTNPHLKRSLMNTLLVEKTGGSFHIALGNAYQMTEYKGEPVNVDNGNRSDLHWDITTMLYGKKGTIEVDGRLIMKDGFFIDTDKYDVLNRGWESITRDKRPDYWKDYYENDPATNQIRLGLPIKEKAA